MGLDRVLEKLFVLRVFPEAVKVPAQFRRSLALSAAPWNPVTMFIASVAHRYTHLVGRSRPSIAWTKDLG